jgi:D-xylono/L-arabinono-1,4-lactonase
MHPELIADYGCTVGEGPLWHEAEQRIYWVDIPNGRLFCFDPASESHSIVHEGDVIGGFTIQADGALLLFGARGSVTLWRGGEILPVIDEIPDERDTRFNDVAADPAGRVLCGTMPTDDRSGRLYRLDTDRSLTLVLDGLGISNGIGFTPDRRYVYHTDTTAGEIHRYEYDESTGDLRNPNLFLRVPEGEGMPDGMTVDSEGFVWSARWDGGALFRYSPDGRLDAQIGFPARKVSSVTFGGADYTDLYVTTAGGDNKESEGEGAGALFRLRPGVRGQPEYLSRIGL